MDILSDMRPSNNYIMNGFVSLRNMMQALWTLFIKLRAVKQMDISDMRPSNNYIMNGFVSLRNMIQALWTLFIKLRGRETNGNIIRHASFQ